ncbi:MAG: hypothetical protein HY438_01280 [DPANN group archaeon]|nr:hypothetical protein [DPANN group archaeon]
MYTNEFTGQQRRPSPTAVGVLNALGRDTSLDILAFVQEESLTLSELARAIKTQKSLIRKYVVRLMSAGFLSDGNGRPLPMQTVARIHTGHAHQPYIAEVTGMGFTYAPADGLSFYVDYHDGEKAIGKIFPRARKSDTQLRQLHLNSKNVVHVFHDPLYLGSFWQGHQIKIEGERFSLENVTSTFDSRTARLDVRLAGREEPIIAVREFSPKLYVPSSELGTVYPSTSR